MKQLIPLFILAVLFTGCLNETNNNDCVAVDESAYLTQYAQQAGVVKRDSGLLYKVLEQGDGEIPQTNQVVFVDFDINLITGETVASTNELTFFTLDDNVLPGLREGLSIMSEGATYELVLPSELAFGENPPTGTPIRCGSVIIYEVILDSFLRDVETYLSENAEREDVTVTESGLQYRVIEEGEGDTPLETSSVRIKYKGALTNGVVFDQTTGDNTADFNVSGLISGFTEGLLLMNEGSKFELFLPPNLAYGNSPPGNAIPPNAILVFEVELVEIL